MNAHAPERHMSLCLSLRNCTCSCLLFKVWRDVSCWMEPAKIFGYKVLISNGYRGYEENTNIQIGNKCKYHITNIYIWFEFTINTHIIQVMRQNCYLEHSNVSNKMHINSPPPILTRTLKYISMLSLASIGGHVPLRYPQVQECRLGPVHS